MNNNTNTHLCLFYIGVKTFILHPKYNVSAKVKQGVKEFYDYDVALIQLKEHVDFSYNIR